MNQAKFSNAIAKTITYICPESDSVKVIRSVVYEKDPLLSKSCFDNHDKKMMYLIRNGKPLVVTS